MRAGHVPVTRHPRPRPAPGHDALETAIHLLSEAIGVARRDGTLVSANPALTAALTDDATPAVGLDLLANVHPGDVGVLRDLLDTQGDVTATVRFLGPRRVPHPHDVRAVALDADRVLLECHDVTAELLVQAQLRDAQQRLSETFDAAPFGMALCTTDGAVLEPNPALVSMLGVPFAEVLGRRLTDLVAPDQRDVVRALLDACAVGSTNSREVGFGHHGNRRWLRLSVARVERDGEAGAHLLLQAQDVTAHHNTEQQLRHDRYHDALTGLANRRLLGDRMAAALARPSQRAMELAVLFVDIDHFTTVNDRYGHEAGDQVLCVAAERLRLAVRPEDTVARVNGDEFVVLLDGLRAGTAEAELVAARLREELSNPIRMHDGGDVVVAATIGIALAGVDHSPDRLLREASIALDRARSELRHGQAVFDDHLRAAAIARLSAEHALQAALGRGGVEVHYQPIVELATGRIAGAEALARLRTAEGVLLQPAEFLDVAEDTGLVVPLGAEVLWAACHQAASWRAETGSDDFRMSVNVSLRQLTATFVDLVRDVLTATKLPASALCLEVTESMLLSAAPTARRVLGELDAMGVVLALDDFGTGASSLTYLRSFPVQVIKADRSFVSNATTDAADLAIVQAVVDLGNRLGKAVVAEGVETPADLQLLREIGATYAQGYLISRPEPATDFGVRLRRQPPVGATALVAQPTG